MKKFWVCIVMFGCTVAPPAWAHFQMMVPSTDIVEDPARAAVGLQLVFTHPMENGPAMEMGSPRQFGVMVNGKKNDLLDTLQREPVQGKTAYTAAFTVTEPADYVFYLEPAAYWEPTEQKMIIHYTKVVVDGFDAETGWDSLVGFPVEIEPLVRPYGLWTGNEFRGIVRKNGTPVPFAEIEVEYYNADQAVSVPADPFITQVIKADPNGVFSYCLPRQGWWGFAALLDGDKPMKNPDGDSVPVELGGLIWVQVRDMAEARAHAHKDTRHQ